jgi:hypothetical protein
MERRGGWNIDIIERSEREAFWQIKKKKGSSNILERKT